MGARRPRGPRGGLWRGWLRARRGRLLPPRRRARGGVQATHGRAVVAAVDAPDEGARRVGGQGAIWLRAALGRGGAHGGPQWLRRRRGLDGRLGAVARPPAARLPRAAAEGQLDGRHRLRVEAAVVERLARALREARVRGGVLVGGGRGGRAVVRHGEEGHLVVGVRARRVGGRRGAAGEAGRVVGARRGVGGRLEPWGGRVGRPGGGEGFRGAAQSRHGRRYAARPHALDTDARSALMHRALPRGAPPSTLMRSLARARLGARTKHRHWRRSPSSRALSGRNLQWTGAFNELFCFAFPCLIHFTLTNHAEHWPRGRDEGKAFESARARSVLCYH